MEQIEKAIEKIKGNISDWERPDVYKACLASIDLTTLNSTDTNIKVAGMIDKVNGFHDKFPQYPSVAAVCVYPNFASLVREKLNVDNVKIAVVAGAFPTSQSFEEIKVSECKMAAERGADEIDIVLALNKFLASDSVGTYNEICNIKSAIGRKHLKVILETGALKNKEQIESAAELAIKAGADFIKTSTGKMEPAATPEAAYIMCSCIKKHYEKTGLKIGFKPAGGISTPQEALLYYAITESILGKEWLNPGLFRIGASRLANNLLSILERTTVSYF